MKHVFNAYMSEGVRTDPFHPFSPEEWNHQTSTMMRTFLVQHLPTPIGPEPVTSGPIPSSKSTAYSPAALELMSFKKGIKREITAYPSLKDERYFDGFKRSLFIVAKTHECSDVLDPNYTPGSEPEEQELLGAKQTFMFSVFNTNLQTDMGKTIVRKHLASTDAQAVWKELSEHMKTSIIYRSAVRPKKSSTPNHRLAPHGGEVSTSSDPSEDKISSGSPLRAPEGSSPEQKAPTVFIRSRDEDNPSGSKPMPTFDPSDIIGRTFLLPPEENGERHRAKVTRKVVEIIDQEDGK